MRRTPQLHLQLVSLGLLGFCGFFLVKGTKVSEGKEAGKWEIYLHAIRLLKINTYNTVLISQIQMQMKAESQSLEYSPLKKGQL